MRDTKGRRFELDALPVWKRAFRARMEAPLRVSMCELIAPKVVKRLRAIGRT